MKIVKDYNIIYSSGSDCTSSSKSSWVQIFVMEFWYMLRTIIILKTLKDCDQIFESSIRDSTGKLQEKQFVNDDSGTHNIECLTNWPSIMHLRGRKLVELN